MPGWLDRLVEEMIASYSLPSPATWPALWPEVGGLGVLLTDPDHLPKTNSQTLRFMAPGLSPRLPDGYMLITDEAGGYVDPKTGGSRFATPVDPPSTEPVTREINEDESHSWRWPSDAKNESTFDHAGCFEGRKVLRLHADRFGWRLMLELADRPEPLIYIDLAEPWHETGTGWRRATQDDASTTAASTIDQVRVIGSTLEIETAEGARLRSAANEDFESWQLLAADVGLWVCAPGGRLACFRFA